MAELGVFPLGRVRLETGRVYIGDPARQLGKLIEVKGVCAGVWQAEVKRILYEESPHNVALTLSYLGAEPADPDWDWLGEFSVENGWKAGIFDIEQYGPENPAWYQGLGELIDGCELRAGVIPGGVVSEALLGAYRFYGVLEDEAVVALRLELTPEEAQ